MLHKGKWIIWGEVSVVAIACGIIFSSWVVCAVMLVVCTLLITLKKSAYYFYLVFSFAWSVLVFYFALQLLPQIVAVILAMLMFILLMCMYFFSRKDVD